MVLVVQISGFLGSGKTSTIVRLATLARQRMGSRVAVIVNEIGDVDVDGEFVKGAGFYSKKLLGGCLCCSLGTDLVSTMKSVIEEYNPDMLFVEPTGVALPSQVKGFFAQASYIVNGIEFSPIVTLVDGTRYRFLLNDFRTFFMKQMKDAAILVVTKVDKLDKKFELPLIVAALRETHPKAKLIGASSVTGEGFDELLRLLLSEGAPMQPAETAAPSLDSVQGSEVGSADFYGRLLAPKPLGDPEIKAIVKEILMGIGSTCKSPDGHIIGHIKSYVKAGDSGFKASLVDMPSGVDFSGNIPSETDSLHCSIFLAISGFESSFLNGVLKAELERAGTRYGLKIEDSHHQTAP